MNMMEKIFRLKQPELKKYMEKYFLSLGYAPENQDGFLYCAGKIPVLLIAHLDTVHKEPVYDLCKSNTNVWMSPQGIGGDDRCGVYALATIARRFNCHILLCEDEEIGCKGAKKFVASGIKPDVNYIIEIDRKGSDDAVYYSCDNPDFEKFVTNHGFKTAYGSCSDISDVAPYIGISAVNLSSGYYNAHTVSEYVVISEIENTIARVIGMISADYTTKFPYIEKALPKYDYSKYYSRWDTDDDYYDRFYGYSYGKSKKKDKSDKKEETALLKVDNPDKAIDIIWLNEGDYYIQASCKNEVYYVSCENYGVDRDGNVYHEDKKGVIKIVKNVIFKTQTGIQVIPRGIYIRESYFNSMEPT